MTQENSYLWVGAQIAEKRRSTGSAVERQYFAQGFTEGAATYFYTRDHLGSIREVLNSGGAILARYDYSPFGEVETLTETTTSDFRYTGHFYHAPTGLHLTLYRAYDPAQGRWLSRDPIGELGGLNLYGYVGNNVVNWIDSFGLSTDRYVPDVDKHGGAHIDRYTKNGQNVGRYRIDGTPMKHANRTPPPIPKSDRTKFNKAADDCKRKMNLRQGPILYTTGDESLQVIATMAVGGAILAEQTTPVTPSPSASSAPPSATPSSSAGSGGTIKYRGKTYNSVNGVLTPVD